MKKLVFSVLSAVLFAQPVFAGVFLEPIKGTDKIYRGRAPKATEIKKMVKTGITTVVIFKNQVKNEVSDEIKQLTAAGFDRKKIHHIPFQWKDIKSEKQACEQIMDALSVLQKVQISENDTVLFHCTVGEDRTGLLAGLMTQILRVEDTDSSYRNQMCAKGFAGGNENKPAHVSAAVDKFLTPLFFKMSHLIRRGSVTEKALNKSVCARIAEVEVKESYKTCSELAQ